MSRSRRRNLKRRRIGGKRVSRRERRWRGCRVRVVRVAHLFERFLAAWNSEVCFEIPQ